MKALLCSLALLPLVLLMANDAAQAYDTCAPHRAGFYGYGGHGGGLGGMARGGRVQPFQGMVNPRYARSSYDVVVVEPQPHYTTRSFVHLPREIRERQQRAIDVASDEQLLEGPPPPPTPPSDYTDRYRDVSRQRTPRSEDSFAPPVRVPQPQLIAATSYKARAVGVVAPKIDTMSAEAAELYAARSEAAMTRLKLQREMSREKLAVRP
jgi:hypothetical protein